MQCVPGCKCPLKLDSIRFANMSYTAQRSPISLYQLHEAGRLVVEEQRLGREDLQKGGSVIDSGPGCTGKQFLRIAYSVMRNEKLLEMIDRQDQM